MCHSVSGWSGHEAVFDQHLQPARGIARHHQGFVVHRFVHVVRFLAQHRVDRAQHLVPQCHDGAFVALAHVEGLELVLERAAAAPGGLRELAQQPAHPGVAFPDTPAFALACGLVVTRTHPHPGG